MKTNYFIKLGLISQVRHVGLMILMLLSCVGSWSQTVFTDIPDITLNPSNPSTDLDLDGDMITDFTVYFTSSPAASFFEISGPAGNNVLTDSIFGDARNLSSGVDSVAMGSSSWHYLSSGPATLVLYYPSPVGSWSGGAVCKYVGICFVSGGANHFGWLWVDIADGTTPEVTIKGYAYNSSPLMPIQAGDGASCTPSALFSASADTIYVGDCISFTDGSSNSPSTWSWEFAGATPSSSNVQNPMNICYNTQGTFDVSLVVGNSFGLDTVYSEITVLPPSSTPEYDNAQLTLFPNPTEGRATINFNIVSDGYLQVIDATGRMIHEKFLYSNQSQVEIDLKEQTKGIYFIRLTAGSRSATEKLVYR